MSKNDKDAILDDEGEDSVAKKPETKTKTDTKTGTSKPKTEKERLLAEAQAKFPNDIVAQTKYILYAGTQVNFIVPLGEFEKQGAFETVRINGYRLTIQKGVMVTIPLQIANLLANKYKIAMTAGAEKQLDTASDDKKEALG